MGFNISSVCYTDRAVAWDKIWNPNVKIEDTAQSPSLDSFTKLGDLESLKNLKVKVDRDKLYKISDIRWWWRNQNDYKIIGYYIDNKGFKHKKYSVNGLAQIKPSNKLSLFSKACKALGIDISKQSVKNNTNTKCYQISLSQWELIRNKIFEIADKSPSKLTWEFVKKGQKKGGYIYILDMFFNNIKEYELEQRMKQIEIENAWHNLLDTPKQDEESFIAIRIFKNSEILKMFLVKAWIYRFNGGVWNFRNPNTDRRRHLQATKVWLDMTFQIEGKIMTSKFRHCLLTIRQLKAIYTLMGYLKTHRADYIDVGRKQIENFLRKQNEWEERYGVKYTPNKVYRSLWL